MLQKKEFYIRESFLEELFIRNDFAAFATCGRNIEILRIENEDDTKLPINGFRALAKGILKRNKPVSAFSYNEQFSIVS